MNRVHRCVRAVLLTWVLSVGLGTTAWGSDRDPLAVRAEGRDLWTRAIDLVEPGQLPVAVDPLDLANAAGRSGDARVKGWLETHEQRRDELEQAKRKDFERYCELGQKKLEEGKVREALIYAIRASDNAPDEAAFRQTEWVQRLTSGAVAKANEFREADKWRQALAIYYELADLFEDNKTYDQARKECLAQARLDAIYNEKRKNPNPWRETLEGIESRAALEALDRINRHYVEEADFRKIAESGLEALLTLCEAKVLREVFPGLADEGLRREFADRLSERLRQVRKTEHCTADTVKEHFRRVVEDINKTTVKLPDSLITYEFMVGALDPLDEFTSMIWPAEFREFDKHTRGDFVGVGISIAGGGDNPIRVVTPLEDAPAYRAGIVAEDQITHVNGEPLKGVSLNKVVQTITGPIGTEVTLTIYRESQDRSLDFTLKRALVQIQTVKGVSRLPDDREKWDFTLDSEMGIAYVRVGSFQENSIPQLREAIEQSIAKGARGLILDLRFNPGGLLKAAVEMTQLFLYRDEKVVETKGLRDAPWRNPQADEDGPFVNLPLIVLVNEYSASASEIVSGALRDNRRAVVIGERTFGKFSVQKLMQLGNNDSHLKLTTARYYLPSGQSLHHDEGATDWGVRPDFTVKLAPKEIGRVVEIRREKDVLAAAEPKPETTEPKEDSGEVSEAKDPASDEESVDVDEGSDEEEDKLDLEPDPNELPKIDRQLDTAVLLMRLYLLGETELRVARAIERETDTKVEPRHPQ